MDQIVKNAMMEFIEPGSSIPFDKVLEKFAIMCNETKRGSFYITKNVRTQKWRVHLSAAKKTFVGDSLRQLIMQAGQYVFDKRVKAETEFIINP